MTDEMVCFALYASTRATTQAYRALLEPWGLTYPQYLVLVTLWIEGPQTVRSLGERMQLDSGTLSPLLRRMEEDGLVERSRRDDDGRVVDVRPTERGLALRGELAHVPTTIASAMGIADADDGQALLDRIHAVTDSLQRHAAQRSTDQRSTEQRSTTQRSTTA